jgi:hypothetical protein
MSVKFPRGINTIITASFKTRPFDPSTGATKEITEVINMFPSSRGVLSKVSYRSFRGLIKELKRANTNCRKHGFTTEIRIKLPLNW